MKRSKADLVAIILCLAHSLDFVAAFSGPQTTTRVIGTSHRKVVDRSPLPIQLLSTIEQRLKTRVSMGQTTVMENKQDTIPPMMTSLKDDMSLSSASISTQASEVEEEPVPSTWKEALHRFFIADVGPPLVVLSISGFIYTRSQLPTPFSIAEAAVFVSAILFWWLQEYFLHRVVLHSRIDWIGKSIHQTHHQKSYFHVSIDAPELLLGWLFTAYLIMRQLLPWHICLTATVGYALAGLLYEWNHYIVHTKVKVKSSLESSSPIMSAVSRLFSQMRANHMRHHLLDNDYWYAFSVPQMDDLFCTNPDVREVRRAKRRLVDAKKEQ